MFSSIPMGFFEACIAVLFFLQLLGPVFSTYRYEFQEDGFRILVRFLGFIPMPGTTIRYRRIMGAARIDGAKSHFFAFIGSHFFALFLSVLGGDAAVMFMEWGNIWKKKGVLLYHDCWKDSLF